MNQSIATELGGASAGATGAINGLWPRIKSRLRWLAVRGLASTIAGTLVLGGGGRIVMLVSRLIHPDAVGQATEGGNRVGEFTVEGTMALIIFAGLFSGMFAAVTWALIAEWVPARPRLVRLLAVPLGGPFLIKSDNVDFFILGNPLVDILMLLGLLFLFGVVLVVIQHALDRRLAASPGTFAVVVYALLTAIATPLIVPVFGNFFSSEFCFCDRPPVWPGVFLAATALLTGLWWIQHMRGAAQVPSPRMRNGGAFLVALAAAVGSFHLGREIVDILL